MKIVNLCLGNFFADNHSYQENVLPKYQKKLGYDVEIIASTQSYNAEGKVCYLNNTEPYRNEDDIQVTRLPFKSGNKLWRKLKRYIGTYEVLEKAAPDILFIHGCQFMDVSEIIKYKKKHPYVTIFVDNHADFKNSAKNFLSRILLHRILWRKEAKRLLPDTEMFYGVLPARVDFLKEVYKLPAEKVALLCIGADDEYAEKYSSQAIRKQTRQRYGYSDTDMVVVTGGKINSNRPETLELMKAVTECSNLNVKLLIFGSVAETYKEQFDELCKDKRIQFIGWLTPEQTYEVIAAADLAAFPGLHSVMWEQAVAQGIPCLFRKIEGFDHVDIGGNAYFCEEPSEAGLSAALDEIFGDPQCYANMKKAAAQPERKRFYYSEIAKKSIEPRRP